jgi:peptidoglycan/LPS O-acetylase OafA/YrhL
VLVSALPLPTSVPVPGKTLILVHLPYFALGILAFQRCSGRSRPLSFALALTGVVAFLLARGAGGGAVAGLLAALVVATPWPGALATSGGGETPGAALAGRALRHLGRISYSLYLVHLPVGMWTAWHLTQGTPARWLGPSAPVVAALVALGGSLVVAQLLYVLVERPALRLAQRIGHRPAERPLAGRGNDAGSVRAHVGHAIPPVGA